MNTPICSTDYMKETLKFFPKELVYGWLEKAKTIDAILYQPILDNLETIHTNKNTVTLELVKKFSDILREKNQQTDYDLKNLEAFHGYIVYSFMDNKEMIVKTGNPDLYYGIVKTTSYGKAHTHKLSNAFNFMLEGEGVFIGAQEDKDKFDYYYHEARLIPGFELEIPIGMTHGHLVKNGGEIWFLFVQQCGFKPELRCAGDFYVRDDCSISSFGPYYV